jgi:Carboxypeptidase regulatory-like domain
MSRPAALVALVALAALSACDPTASPTSTPSPTTAACGAEEVRGGGISGRIVDTDGNPLGDILVLIEVPGGFTGETRTGEDGLFSAPDVSGEFRISTTDIDHEPLVRTVTVPCGELVEVELVLTPVED